MPSTGRTRPAWRTISWRFSTSVVQWSDRRRRVRMNAVRSRPFLNLRADARGVRLVATGRLVLGHGADWEAWSPRVAATPGRVVRVDLSAVTDIDAAGIGLLVRLAVQARCHGRTL